MEEIKLEVQVRSEIGGRNVKDVRRQDAVPGVVYGAGEDATPIKFDKRTYERIRRLHQGENIVFHLNVFDGGKKLKDYPAIVKEEQQDPISDRILHVDFKHISLTEKIEVKVGIVAKGEPIGVKKDGGSLEHIVWELDVICLPTQIPQHINVDVSNMQVGDNICVKDLVLPEGVVTEHDPEAIVLTVVAAKEEEIEAEPTEGAALEPEVIKEKKEKSSEEGAEEGGEEKGA